MAWQSDRERLTDQLMTVLPGISRKEANALSSGCWGAMSNWKAIPTISETIEWIKATSDDDLLCIRNFGEVSLRHVRSALAEERYGLAGPCNWVGEGVPA